MKGPINHMPLYPFHSSYAENAHGDDKPTDVFGKRRNRQDKRSKCQQAEEKV
jgi:hypothetical protein